MDFSSFLTSLSTSFVIFVILMLLFSWLSRKPGNDVVYYPNRILKGLDSSSRTRNPISWIKEAVSSSEDDIIAVSGVDTAVYFIFLSTGIIIINYYYISALIFFFFFKAMKHVNLFRFSDKFPFSETKLVFPFSNRSCLRANC